MTTQNEQPVVLPEGDFGVIMDDDSSLRTLVKMALHGTLDMVEAANVAQFERVTRAAAEAGRNIVMAMYDGRLPFGDDRDHIDSQNDKTPTQAALAATDDLEAELAEKAQQSGGPQPMPVLRVYIGSSGLDYAPTRQALGISNDNFHKTPGKNFTIDGLEELAKQALSGER